METKSQHVGDRVHRAAVTKSLVDKGNMVPASVVRALGIHMAGIERIVGISDAEFVEDMTRFL